MSANYIHELVEEMEILDPDRSMFTIQLLEEEIHRVKTKAKKKEKEKMRKEEVVKLTEKIIVPVDKYPGYNFIGKLMGPKATTLRRIQSETRSTILILGKGSARNGSKEKLLSESNDVKYGHYNEPLHIVISVKAFKSEAEKQLNAAVAEVKKYMDPNNEEVKQESLRTLAMLITPNSFNGKLAPIIRVGIPPAGASLASMPDPYKYEATYDGTYEGYPSTADSLASEYIQETVNAAKRTISSDVHPGPADKKIKTDSCDPEQIL